MTVLLVGQGGSPEFELLAEAIEDRGADPVTWDTTDWPSDLPVTYDLGSDSVTVDDEFPVEEVTGVFALDQQIFDVRLSRFADEVEERGAGHMFFKLSQWRSVFNSAIALFERHGATVFSPPRTQHYHDSKPLQMAQFAKADVSVPDTTFTTDAERVREFVTEHGEVVYKPVVTGAAPNRLSADDLEDAPLDRLASAPVQFQEYVPGDDHRVFFLDGEVIGASRYVTDDWTFKTSPTETAESVDLPAEARRDVERAAEVSPLRFGAADLRMSGDSHALLEVNPGPRFAFHDVEGATDVAGVLAESLVK